MLKVSVVIPCYNHGKYINDAVNSVLDQTFQDFEIIIVNDGSTDKFTNTILMNYSKPKTRVIHTENKGLSNARNIGITEAKGIYILPLDADDYIGSTYLQKAVNILDNNKNVKIVYSLAEKFGDINEKWDLSEFSLDKIKYFNLIFCSAIYRRSDWLQIGGYDINLKYGLEDWDLWLSMIKAENEVHRITETLFYYRIKKRSMISSMNWKKELLSRIIIYKKHKKLYKKLNIRWRFIKTSLCIIYRKIRHEL